MKELHEFGAAPFYDTCSSQKIFFNIWSYQIMPNIALHKIENLAEFVHNSPSRISLLLGIVFIWTTKLGRKLCPKKFCLPSVSSYQTFGHAFLKHVMVNGEKQWKTTPRDILRCFSGDSPMDAFFCGFGLFFNNMAFFGGNDYIFSPTRVWTNAPTIFGEKTFFVKTRVHSWPPFWAPHITLPRVLHHQPSCQLFVLPFLFEFRAIVLNGGWSSPNSGGTRINPKKYFYPSNH